MAIVRFFLYPFSNKSLVSLNQFSAVNAMYCRSRRRMLRTEMHCSGMQPWAWNFRTGVASHHTTSPLHQPHDDYRINWKKSSIARKCTMLRAALPCLRVVRRLNDVIGNGLTKRGFAVSPSQLAKKMPDRPPLVAEDDFTEKFLCGSGPGGQKIVRYLPLSLPSPHSPKFRDGGAMANLE